MIAGGTPSGYFFQKKFGYPGYLSSKSDIYNRNKDQSLTK